MIFTVFTLLYLVDIIDPVKDAVSSSDYTEEEDPLLYKSKKTGRGPMKEDWLGHYRVDKPPADVMCAYKLIKVEFRYWGMQVIITWSILIIRMCRQLRTNVPYNREVSGQKPC